MLLQCRHALIRHSKSTMPARVSCVVSQCKLRLGSCQNGWCIMACHGVLVVRQLWWWCVIHVGSGSATGSAGLKIARLTFAFAKTPASSRYGDVWHVPSVLQVSARATCRSSGTSKAPSTATREAERGRVAVCGHVPPCCRLRTGCNGDLTMQRHCWFCS